MKKQNYAFLSIKELLTILGGPECGILIPVSRKWLEVNFKAGADTVPIPVKPVDPIPEPSNPPVTERPLKFEVF